MSWHVRWAALSARMASLLETGKFLTSTVGTTSSDHYGVINSEVIPNAAGIFTELQRLRDHHLNEMPPLAANALNTFVNRHRARFQNDASRLSGWPGLQFVVGALSSFRAEFSDLLADTEAIARSLTLRAFLHLQRSIVADTDFKERWQRAFNLREVACEKLGAVHLLSHGIWAFKVDAIGERTDLVLGEPLAVTPEVRTSSEALVLTEWKLVDSPSDMEKQAEQALTQARKYSVGALAGFELSSVRFLILVSEDRLAPPPDVLEGGVVYRYVNVAVRPKVPSRR